MNKRIVVGMSGGVDSSVSAYLLKQEGYDVVGVTMKIWQDDMEDCDGSCCGLSAVNDARAVCDKLEIPYYVVNFTTQFKHKVIDYFIDEYLNGRTPNPCIACNKHLKWESLLQKSLEIGADYIATGHYANIIKIGERYTIKKSLAKKDQSYALFNMTQEQLGKTIFPIKDIEKDNIREIAREIGLSVSEKKDSQEICFIPDNNHGKFISKRAAVKKGNFINEQGKILGQHNGIIYYTIGQKKGLGLSLGRPFYVKEIDSISNNIILTDLEENLYQQKMNVVDINYMLLDDVIDEVEAFAKIRYSHKPAKCKIKKVGNVIECIFEEPQRAITKGQAAVFYDENDHILLGGIIY